VMPQLTSPATHAGTPAPVTLQWNPLDLESVPGTSQFFFQVDAWIVDGANGDIDNSNFLSPMDGQATWSAGSTSWTSLELKAELIYGFNKSIYVSHHVPVN
jgi:hypothetical protein